MLKAVNEKFNAYPYRADPAAFDDWSPVNELGGDCDSYAVGKYRALVAEGFNAGPLRLAVGYTEPFTVRDAETELLRDATMDERRHAVLLADVEGETWVLDNRHPYPMRYADLPYKWDRLQIAGTAKWEMA